MSAPKHIFAALAAGALVWSSAAERSAMAGAAQDHVLIQLQRGQKSKGQGECAFAVPPETPYYWEANCTLGEVGCWADGVHAECRFCSYHGIECPASAVRPARQFCDFDNPPSEQDVGYYHEPECRNGIDGGLGCNADGKNVECRLCGGSGNYSQILCKEDRCTFPNEPATPYFWDPECEEGQLGCLADGIHKECRYCGKRPFDSIECPASANIPKQACWFRNPPAIGSFYDESCRTGEVGCWADGIHEKCRFCGASEPPYNTTCPQ